MRTIAEALRLMPGLQVMRTSAQAYNVTARGLSGDKLQVLVDGRSVYTPLNSTVFWDVRPESSVSRFRLAASTSTSRSCPIRAA